MPATFNLEIEQDDFDLAKAVGDYGFRFLKAVAREVQKALRGEAGYASRWPGGSAAAPAPFSRGVSRRAWKVTANRFGDVDALNETEHAIIVEKARGAHRNAAINTIRKNWQTILRKAEAAVGDFDA